MSNHSLLLHILETIPIYFLYKGNYKWAFEKLQYPIGKYTAPDGYSAEFIKGAIYQIATFPERLKQEVIYLNEEQLDTPYRKEGWTIRQVIHHCGDSHMNCYIRLKWALTEEIPIIKYYYEQSN